MLGSRTSKERLASFGRALPMISGAAYLIAYLAIAIARIRYPFELEWMEGSSVVQVQRLLDGQSLYVAPSLDFVPFAYSPLYFYLSSLVAGAMGNGFAPLRLVSLLASLGCFVFIFMIVYRRTSSRQASFLAVCLFAATFRISGAWFDIARVDSLFLLLLLAAIHTFDSPRMATRALASPTLLFLSFFTKQTAMVVAIGLSAAALLSRRGFERFLFPLVFAVLMAGSLLLMNALTDGWYQYYAFYLPAQHALVQSALVTFWTSDLMRPLAVALCIGLLPFIQDWNTAGFRLPDKMNRDLFIAGSLVLASYMSRLQSGGYDNVLMPLYAGVAIYFGVGWALAMAAVRKHRALKPALVAAALIQFAALFYVPGRQIPSPEHKRQGEFLLQRLSSVAGAVYMPDHPWYLGLLNKPTQAHGQAVTDVLRAPDSSQWQRKFEEELAAAVAQRRYEAIVMDSTRFSVKLPDLQPGYELVDSDLSEKAFLPPTGAQCRPRYLYLRRDLVRSDPTQDGKPGR